MDELNLELLNSDQQKKIIENMSLAYRAKIKKPWPDYLTAKGIHRFPIYLSIKEICDLLFPIPPWTSKPDDKSKLPEFRSNQSNLRKCNRAFKDQLIDECTEGKLSYEGDITGWRHGGKIKNRHPLAKKGTLEQAYDAFIEVGSEAFSGELKKQIRNSMPITYKCEATDCTIHKAEFKRYHKSVKKWTMVNKGLLSMWLADDAVETDKPIGDADKKRLKRLQLFVSHVWLAKDNKGEPELPLQIPCERKTIYLALRDWEKKRIKKNKEIEKVFLKITDSTFFDFWKIPEAKEICRGTSRGVTEDDLFFENINYNKTL